MTNTIELLETIGRDASLRHSTGEALSQALTGLQASEALRQAAISGDDSHLARELGHRDIKSPNYVNNNIGGGQEDDDDGDSNSSSQTDGDGNDKDAEERG